jgi:hypothetical protein
MARRKWLILKIPILLIGSIIILGYISDFISARVCERRVARWIANDILGGMDFFVIPPHAEESLGIFQSIGANVHKYIQRSDRFDGFPWGEVRRAKIRYPFVVSVEWGYVSAPLAGMGCTRKFYCFFGFIFLSVEDESGGWVT